MPDGAPVAAAVPPGSRPRPQAPVLPTAVTSTQFADLCGVNPSTVYAWTQRGLPTTRDAPLTFVELAVGIQWLRAQDAATITELRAARDPDGAKVSKLVAESRLKQLDVAEREGALVPADEVEARWIEMMTALREAVMASAGAAVQAGLVQPTQEGKLSDLLRDALTGAQYKARE